MKSIHQPLVTKCGLTLFSWIFLLTLCTQAAERNLLNPEKPGMELLLAENGRAVLPIVTAPNASSETKAVAAELGSYLAKITSAQFSVQNGDGSKGIILGTLEQFPGTDPKGQLAMRGPFDGKEAFLIRSETDRLLLIGRTDLAVSHAAFRFLEMLGCRWFFPAKEWEVLPSSPTLKINADEARRPAILARRIWYGYGSFHEHNVPAGKVSAEKAYRDWSRHNRMAGSFYVHAGHAWEEIIHQNKITFDQNPEYYALVKDKRTGPQLCTSNETVRRMAVDYARNYFSKNPKADMVSLEAADGSGQCECTVCKELGSISDRVFGFANHVAKVLQSEFPGKQVGVLAYNEHCEPPTFALEPNVYVQLTAGFITGRFTFEELVDLWPQKSKNLGFYEYFSVWLWDFDKLPGGRGANVPYIQKQIKLYASKGATSMDAESGNNWGLHGRGYYLANQLMWNPEVAVGPILEDFYQKAFGKGAEAMRRYYERLDPGNTPLMSQHLLGLAFRDVDEAARLAKNDAPVQARLAHLKQYLHYVHLRWNVERESEKAKKKEALQAVFTHLYRTRYTFMNHWEAARQSWIPDAAKELGETSWTGDGAPWRNTDDYSAEETESLFQEGLAYFKPDNISEITFSADLVPVRFEATTAQPTSHAYQGGVRYAMYSLKGEPITVDVVTGTIAWYRDRAAARFQWLDSTGHTIQEGRLPQDGNSHTLSAKVPKAGLYYLDFNDMDAGWAIKSPTNQPVTILLRKDRGFAHAGWMQPVYFYVPKGTKQLEYYWNGGSHKIHGPDKQVLQQITTSGAFVKIPVPEGADGKPWSFSEFAPGHLWFFNAPNQLSANPALILVPREVATKDGLMFEAH